MIKIIDFTNLELSSRNMQYGGRAGVKRGVMYNGDFWMIKFPKDTKELRYEIGMSYSSAPYWYVIFPQRMYFQYRELYFLSQWLCGRSSFFR